MRIAYVFYHEYERIPIHTAEVVEEMARQGHQVTVVTAVAPQVLAQVAWGGRVRVRQVPLLKIPGLRALSFALGELIRLPAWCRQDHPDVLYERCSFTSLATLWVSRLAGLPLVVEVNGIARDELALSHASRLRIGLQEWLERRVFRGCGHVIAVTEGIRQWIHERHAVALEQITAIPNGTNPTRFRPMERAAARRQLGLEPERPVVGYLGSFFPWCGLELVVEAAPAVVAKVPDALFLIGGTGQDDIRAGLERRVQALGLREHFRFFGFIPFDDAAVFINAFDVAVAPVRGSRLRSGLSSLKSYAYLSCERPIVGSDTAGLGDLLTTQGTGLAFPDGDVAALAESLVKLLRDPDLAERMGRQGRQVVLEQFTWERVVHRTLAICAEAATSAKCQTLPEAGKVSDTS